MAAVTIEELIAERDDLKSQVVDLEKEHEGIRFDPEAKEKWNRLNAEVDERNETIAELERRQERIAAMGEKPEHVEREKPFHVGKRVAGGDNIYDLSTVERNWSDPSVEGRELKDRAKKAIEQANFPGTRHVAPPEVLQGHAERLLDEIDEEDGKLARRMLVTGSPAYRRAYGKYLLGEYLTHNESQTLAQGTERALSLTGSAGGFAVPFTLDPSIIPTSNLAINPYRAIARVEQITGDEWRGISSAGVTVAYAAEATPTSDNAPTLAQPTISTEKAQAFIPYSIEVGMDWSSLQREMAGLLQDGKDEVEATKFTLGSGTNEPTGVITAATTVYTAAATNAITIADIYGWEGSLGPRFRPRATFVMNGGIANRIRQFDTAGGASIWVDNLGQGLLSNDIPTSGQLQSRLLNHPAYESSAMSSTMTTGQLIGVFGDFRYFVIVDRIGMNVEVIPHLFDVTNNRPTGQRGLYAYFRNSSGVTSANAFRTLKLA